MHVIMIIYDNPNWLLWKVTVIRKILIN